MSHVRAWGNRKQRYVKFSSNVILSLWSILKGLSPESLLEGHSKQAHLEGILLGDAVFLGTTWHICLHPFLTSSSEGSVYD